MGDWTLKRVQGDGGAFRVAAREALRANRIRPGPNPLIRRRRKEELAQITWRVARATSITRPMDYIGAARRVPSAASP